MTMKDINNDPEWLVWGIFVLLVTLSSVLLSGHGANLITSYNTSSKKKKEKYDHKKLCRVFGTGILIIAFLLPFSELRRELLSDWVTYIFLGIVILDSLTMIALANTICKK